MSFPRPISSQETHLSSSSSQSDIDLLKAIMKECGRTGGAGGRSKVSGGTEKMIKKTTGEGKRREEEGWWKKDARGGEGDSGDTGEFAHLHLLSHWLPLSSSVVPSFPSTFFFSFFTPSPPSVPHLSSLFAPIFLPLQPSVLPTSPLLSIVLPSSPPHFYFVLLLFTDCHPVDSPPPLSPSISPCFHFLSSLSPSLVSCPLLFLSIVLLSSPCLPSYMLQSSSFFSSSPLFPLMFLTSFSPLIHLALLPLPLSLLPPLWAQWCGTVQY